MNPLTHREFGVGVSRLPIWRDKLCQEFRMLLAVTARGMNAALGSEDRRSRLQPVRVLLDHRVRQHLRGAMRSTSRCASGNIMASL